MSASRALGTAFGRVRWRLVVPAALCVMVLTFLLAYAVVFVWDNALDLALWERDARGPWDDIMWFPAFMGTYALPTLHFLLIFVAASWVALRAEEWRMHGLLLGLLATFYGQIVMLILWPTASVEQMLAGWGLLALPFSRMALYLLLGLAAGFLGGAAASAVLARREALVRASREIGAARVPSDVPVAIGRHLAERATVGIALWETAPPDEEDVGFGLLESWTPRGNPGWPPGEELDASRVPTLAGLRGQVPLLVRASGLPEEEREAWSKAGVRSLLAAPLVAPGDEEIGLLTVASRRRFRPFPEWAVRRYSTVAAQAALALENMRLVEEARRIGQEAGTLRERDRLAREIHDTLAQGFVSIVMNLEASDAEGRSNANRIRDEKIERTARESLSEARRLVNALGPGQLEDASLPEALAELARRFSEETGVRAEAVTDGAPLPLPATVEETLLRVAQEALANARKHAQAGRVMLSLSYMGDAVVLDVRDDGKGFDPDAGAGGSEDGVSGGFGLRGMRERVGEADGVLRVESAPGEGTTVTVEVPVEASGMGLQASGRDEGSRARA